jgi:hypothetical protein
MIYYFSDGNSIEVNINNSSYDLLKMPNVFTVEHFFNDLRVLKTIKVGDKSYVYCNKNGNILMYILSNRAEVVSNVVRINVKNVKEIHFFDNNIVVKSSYDSYGYDKITLFPVDDYYLTTPIKVLESFHGYIDGASSIRHDEYFYVMNNNIGVKLISSERDRYGHYHYTYKYKGYIANNNEFESQYDWANIKLPFHSVINISKNGNFIIRRSNEYGHPSNIYDLYDKSGSLLKENFTVPDDYKYDYLGDTDEFRAYKLNDYSLSIYNYNASGELVGADVIHIPFKEGMSFEDSYLRIYRGTALLAYNKENVIYFSMDNNNEKYEYATKREDVSVGGENVLFFDDIILSPFGDYTSCIPLKM